MRGRTAAISIAAAAAAVAVAAAAAAAPGGDAAQEWVHPFAPDASVVAEAGVPLAFRPGIRGTDVDVSVSDGALGAADYNGTHITYVPRAGVTGTDRIEYYVYSRSMPPYCSRDDTVCNAAMPSSYGTVYVTVAPAGGAAPARDAPPRVAQYAYPLAPAGNASIPPHMARSGNEFALDLYRQVSDGDENVFFSPPSIYVAFSALYEGARGDTAEQLRGAFGFEPDAASRHNLTAHALASINRDDPHSDLYMANAMWISRWFEPHDEYLDVGRGVYLAGIETVDFVDPGDAVPRINSWASSSTEGAMREVVGPDSFDALTAMVITNAIYFNGTWQTQFPAGGTKAFAFYPDGGEGVDADFMRVKGTFDHASVGGVQVLRLPYEGGRLSMLLALPGAGAGMDALEESASPGTVAAWRDALSPADVAVSIPKFAMRTSYDLVRQLAPLGVTDAFDAELADLSGIGFVDPLRRLYVSDAAHHAFVDVSERGTEAAAVTAITVGITSAQPLVQFTADRPFLFLILDDESGMILFMGRVSDPTAG